MLNEKQRQESPIKFKSTKSKNLLVFAEFGNKTSYVHHICDQLAQCPLQEDEHANLCEGFLSYVILYRLKILKK